jgi:hypothetical protein
MKLIRDGFDMVRYHPKMRRLALGVRALTPGAYAQDGLLSIHSHVFMQDPRFNAAYARGVKAIGGADLYRFHWRVHIALWAASIGSRLDGDFVECGVNKGFVSSAIMEYLDWNSIGRDFYLLDTFAGLDDRFVSASERESGSLEKNAKSLESGFYITGADSVRVNFGQWPRRHHRGSYTGNPDTGDVAAGGLPASGHELRPARGRGPHLFLGPAGRGRSRPPRRLRVSQLHAPTARDG